jgi:hypothetical protein
MKKTNRRASSLYWGSGDILATVEDSDLEAATGLSEGSNEGDGYPNTQPMPGPDGSGEDAAAY